MKVGTPDTLNQRWAKDTSRFGYKMLQKMGWSEGKGAGKDESGMVSHIKVQKKDDVNGIGSINDTTGNVAFTKQISSFNDVLSSLQQAHQPVKTEKKRKRDDDFDSDSDSEDENDSKEEEDSKIVDNSELTKKKKKKKSKKNEKKKSSKKRKSKSEQTATSVASQKIVSRKANAKLVKSKDVSKYSSMDLKAILGVA